MMPLRSLVRSISNNNYYNDHYLFYAELFKGFKEANQFIKGNVLLGQMYDIKAWLDPVLEKLNNHSNPHIFKFVCDSDGNAKMLYKNWDHNEWSPSDSPGISLLKVKLYSVCVYILEDLLLNFIGSSKGVTKIGVTKW